MTTKSMPTIDALRVRLAPALERAGVLRAYVIGSVATGKATEKSDIDLLVVADSDKPMRHRHSEYGEVRKACEWPADVFPYTPEEVREAVASRRRFVVQALAEGVQIFERGSQPYALDRMVREAVIAEERGEYWAGEGVEWIEDAAGDLDAARLLLGNGMFAPACFNAQQAAEKALKGLAYHRGDRRVREHSLEVLFEMLVHDYPQIGPSRGDMERMDPYYTNTRYPNAPSPRSRSSFTEEEGRAAVAGAETLLGVVRAIVLPGRQE